MALTGKRVVAAAGVAAALISGATVAATASGASGARGGAAARPVAQFRLFKGGWVHGPNGLRSGTARIHVSGPATEQLQIVRSRYGAGKAQLIRDAALLNSQGNAKPLERDFALIAGIGAGHTMWTSLIPGTYFAIDVTSSKQTVAKLHRFMVGPKQSYTAVPQRPALWAVGEETWAKKPYSIPHAGYLRFGNRAKQSHFIEMTRMRPGKTRADITKALKGQEYPNKVFYSGPKNEFSTGVISPGRSMTFDYNLLRGKWAVLCFWPDRKTGMPHAFMGMYRVIVLK